MEQIVKSELGAQAPVYLTGTDLSIGHRAVKRILVFAETQEIERLRSGLSKALDDYPVFAGRIRLDDNDLPYIDCCDAGVSLTIKEFDIALPDYGVSRSSKAYMQQYTCSMAADLVDTNEPLLSIQLNQFVGGGTIIGLTNAHSLADGMAFWNFVMCWAEYTKTGKTGSSGKPLISRACLLDLAQGDGEQSSPLTDYVKLPQRQYRRFFAELFLTKQRCDRCSFRIPTATLKKMKADAQRAMQDKTQWVSTNDLIIALLWKSIVLTQSLRTHVALHTVHNLRYLKRVDVPENYVGNAVINAKTGANRDLLLEASLYDIALMVRHTRDSIRAEDIKQDLAYFYRHFAKPDSERWVDNAIMGILDADTRINNHSDFPMYEIDFGGGTPVWSELAGSFLPRHAVISPDPERLGVIIHLTLPKPHMQKFKLLTPEETVLYPC